MSRARGRARRPVARVVLGRDVSGERGDAGGVLAMAVDHSQSWDERGGEGRGRGVSVGAKGEFGLEGTGKGVGGGVGTGSRASTGGGRSGGTQITPAGGHAMGAGVSVAVRRSGKTLHTSTSSVVLKVNTRVVPRVAVARIARFHRNEGRLGRIGGCVLEE